MFHELVDSVKQALLGPVARAVVLPELFVLAEEGAIDLLVEGVPQQAVDQQAEAEQDGGQGEGVPQGQTPADGEAHEGSRKLYPSPRTVWMSGRWPAPWILRRRCVTKTSMTFVSA